MEEGNVVVVIRLGEHAKVLLQLGLVHHAPPTAQRAAPPRQVDHLTRLVLGGKLDVREFQQVLCTLEQIRVKRRRVARQNQSFGLNGVAQMVDISVVDDSILGDPKTRHELAHDGVLGREIDQEPQRRVR